MKHTIRILPVLLISFLLALQVYADKVPTKSGSPAIKSVAAGCFPGSQFKWLELNNVRTRINTGGDMWWDFENAQYEIPKGSKKMSMFSAALWIGGIDANGQLKLAAHRYRQVGNDYFPGPLTTDGTAAISTETCAAYDKIWAITRNEVDNFLAYWDDPTTQPGYIIPISITEWPAHGDVSKGQSYYLAPFFDRDGDGNYNPSEAGDYPYYDISNELCHTKVPTAEGNGILVDQVLKGDATLWWVFNDKGNIHTETKGQPIGMEIRSQAFAFSTNDEINNMTFYSYEIINRSTYRLTGTYFSQWVDTDLGYAYDDYVGCDVMRGLGYCYNGTPKDGNGQAWAYGDQPPAIGVDFFQGPYLDPDGYDNPSFRPVFNEYGQLAGPSYNSNCAIVTQDSTLQKFVVHGDTMEVFVNSAAINGVNFGNGIVDDERFGMRRFVYHNNSGSGVAWYMTDPSEAPEYYMFLRGIWKDGTKMIYGGNAHESSGGYGPACDFMFPDETDICNWGTKGQLPNGPKKWTEVEAGNQPYDRRFMESAGPFILEPGAVNYITVGIPWARATSGGPWASVTQLRRIDDKCQMLFDNCFKVISGPNAPDLTIRELENQLIIYITNRKTNDAGNNFRESYSEYDPRIQSPPGQKWDSLYRFEGYQIFQLANSNVTVADLRNPDLARQVFQCDVKNSVTRLINFKFDQGLQAAVPVEEVNGSDAGISHSFVLSKDAFSGNTLVNHKQYYYLAVSYAYNNYKTYNPTLPDGLDGQQEPYLQGRKNIKVYTGIPHAPVGPVRANGKYGDGVVVTRIAGQGNGGMTLDFSDETIQEILSKKPADSLNTYGMPTYPIAYHPVYKLGKGPIDVRVIDPLNVKDGTYSVKFDSMFRIKKALPGGFTDTLIFTTRWKLVDNATGKVYVSDTTIDLKNEQIFLSLGLSVSIDQQFNPGPYRLRESEYGPALPNNGFLGATIRFSDSTKTWLSFVPDIDGGGAFNWIRSGQQTDANNKNDDWNTGQGIPYDGESSYEKVLFGTWAPFLLTATAMQDPFGPGYASTPPPISARERSRFSDVASVDIVFTPDKSKWTRCAVVEMGNNKNQNEGQAELFAIRKHRSVNVNGDTAVVSSDPQLNSDYIAPFGMGWFPGYAINIETGERLNIVFGENSSDSINRGRDMLFNPTSRFFDANQMPVFGGKHYIYVMASVKNKKAEMLPNSQLDAEAYDNPPYDGGAHFIQEINKSRITALKKQAIAAQYANAMWVSIPRAVNNQEWLSCDVTIKLRVIKPYKRYFGASPGTSDDLSAYKDNNFWPMFNFSTSAVKTDSNDFVKQTSDLDRIAVVPNPYYAYANYEVNQLDNRVKIVNLPQKCVVTIYASNGTIIRQFNKDESKTYIDWNLKNFAGIPISGGVYIVHIKTDYGEKVVKWFGSLRPVDLNAF